MALWVSGGEDPTSEGERGGLVPDHELLALHQAQSRVQHNHHPYTSTTPSKDRDAEQQQAPSAVHSIAALRLVDRTQ